MRRRPHPNLVVSGRSAPANLRLARPRRGRRRAIALVGTALLAAVALQATAQPPAPAGGSMAAIDPAPRPATGLALEAPTPPATDPADEEPAPATVPFARRDGLVLRLPAVKVVLVGYHEASLRGALALEPVGTLLGNANTTKFAPPDPAADGAPYHVLSSRGRTFPATSAVDIVMRDDDPVLSPVDGVVTEVRPYRLYGSYDDTRIEIRPHDAPHLRVVLIHVDGVRVRAGDEVRASHTELARTANRFPFSSHVDRYTPERWPHVHLEVKDPRLADR